MSKTESGEKAFEDSLSALERIVQQLESGELPLDRALELFEQGLSMAKRCQDQLANVERRVEVLMRERNEIRIVPFEASPGPEKQNRGQPDVQASTAKLPDDDDLIPF